MPGTLKVDIVAPDRRVLQGEAARLRVPGERGSFEILYNHAPLIAAMGIGPLVLTLATRDQLSFATSGGFVEVIGNVVTVLAETVEPSTEIDVDRARAAEERARQRLADAGPDLDRERAEKALERARNRTRVAMGRVGSSSAP